MWVLVQEGLGGNDEAGGADAALQCRPFQKALLQWVQSLRSGETFNGGDGSALSLGSQHQAGVHEPAVEDDIARTAVAVVAPFLAAGQAQLIAQNLQKALARLAQELGVLAIDLGLNVKLLGHFYFSELSDGDNTFYIDEPGFASVGGNTQVTAAEDVQDRGNLALGGGRIVVQKMNRDLVSGEGILQRLQVRVGFLRLRRWLAGPDHDQRDSKANTKE
jgi:hypothetical protein